MVLSIPGPHWQHDSKPLASNLFAFIQAAREDYGDLIAFTEKLSVFSQMPDCAGCVGAFGPHHMEQVLRNLDTFSIPISIAKQHALPPTIVNLSSGMFSLRGQKHQSRRQMFASVFNAQNIDGYHSAIVDGCAAFLDTWAVNDSIEILSAMRKLVLYVLNRVLFGTSSISSDSIGSLVQELLRIRRSYLRSRDEIESKGLRNALIITGEKIDLALRTCIRQIRDHPALSPTCLLADLCLLKNDNRFLLSEDELVAHGHVFYLAGSEPVAVSLTWTLILLSQHPEIRKQIIQEVSCLQVQSSHLSARQIDSMDLLKWVFKESLRLLPPNALMLRITEKAVFLDNYHVPARCEVFLSPYISHREPDFFPQPDEFLPFRWHGFRPSPFAYLPFGAGEKYCLGSNLATQIMKTALAIILQQYELILEDNQTIDWRINVTLMPRHDVKMQICPIGTRELLRGQNIHGTLLQLVPSLCMET